jgi:hypothetical protein
MWCWRRMEKISWPDNVRNEEVLLTVKEQKNILHEISKQKVNWIGYILRRNCLLWQVIEGKIKEGKKWQEAEEEDVGSYWMTLRKGRGYSHLKEEALDHTTALWLSHWNTSNTYSRGKANLNGVIKHSIYFDFLDCEDILSITVMTWLCNKISLLKWHLYDPAVISYLCLELAWLSDFLQPVEVTLTHHLQLCLLIFPIVTNSITYICINPTCFPHFSW